MPGDLRKSTPVELLVLASVMSCQGLYGLVRISVCTGAPVACLRLCTSLLMLCSCSACVGVAMCCVMQCIRTWATPLVLSILPTPSIVAVFVFVPDICIK